MYVLNRYNRMESLADHTGLHLDIIRHVVEYIAAFDVCLYAHYFREFQLFTDKLKLDISKLLVYEEAYRRKCILTMIYAKEYGFMYNRFPIIDSDFGPVYEREPKCSVSVTKILTRLGFKFTRRYM